MKTKRMQPSQSAITSIPDYLTFEPRLGEQICANGITRPEIRCRARKGKVCMDSEERGRIEIDFERSIAAYGKTLGALIRTLAERGALYAAKTELLDMNDESPIYIWFTIDGDATVHCSESNRHLLTFRDVVSEACGRYVDVLCNR